MTVSRRTNRVDAYVGGRVRLRRTLLGLTQKELSKIVGLTLQQVQKYEGGLSRIGAGRLYDLAQALDVRVSFFFDDMAPELSGSADARPSQLSEGPAAPYEPDVTVKRETLELVRDYVKISDPAMRETIRGLVKALGRF